MAKKTKSYEKKDTSKDTPKEGMTAKLPQGMPPQGEGMPPLPKLTRPQ